MLQLKNITRDNSYFNTLKLNRSLMKAADFDREFANIINYINIDLVPIINQFIINIIPGIIGSKNYYLKNVGDGTTTWAPILEWKKYSLDVNQLENLNPTPKLNYILGFNIKTEHNATFEPNEVFQTRQAKITEETGLPIWQKISSSMISNQAITGKHLKDLIPQHYFNPTIRPLKLKLNSISNKHFQNKSITNAKLKPGSILVSKLNFNGMLDKIFRSKVATDPNYVEFVTKCLKSFKAKPTDFSLPDVTSMIFPDNSISNNNFRSRSITKGKIASKCLDDSFFEWQASGNISMLDRQLGYLTVQNLVQGFTLPGKKFQRHSLDSAFFNTSVQRAFLKKGIRPNQSTYTWYG